MKLEIKDIMKLIDTFSNAPVHEMALKSGDTELKLKKEDSQATVLPSVVVPSEPAAAEDAFHQDAVVEPQMLAQGKKAKQSGPGTNMSPTKKITSPLVGTFYRSPSPDAPSFVSVGDIVKKGQSLAIIEAMKIMNHLEADFDMEIVEVMAQNGDLVEFGAELFEVRRV